MKAPDPVICEPGVRQCAPDHSDIAVCSADGTRWEPTSTCKSNEACANNGCVAAQTTLGEVKVLPPAQNMENVPLAPGRYGLAVVNTLAVISSQHRTFPLEITGELLDTSMQATHPVLHRAPPLRRRLPLRLPLRLPFWTGNLLRHRTWQPHYYAVGDERTFKVINEADMDYYPRTGVLRHSGTKVNLWEDITDGVEGTLISDTDLPEAARRIEDALKRDTQVFGAMSDIDGNGKVDVLLTSMLNDLGAFTDPQTLMTLPEDAVNNDSGEVVYCTGVTSHIPVTMLGALVGHEMVHLIYFGKLMEPYKDDFSLLPYSIAMGDLFVAEGVAELGWILTGQLPADTMSYALGNPDYWTLGQLFLASYPQDQFAAYVLYGLGAMIVDYLFEQAGGVEFSADSAVIDHGGLAFINQVIADVPGTQRLAALDGRPVQQVYVDMAAAALRGSLAEYLPALASGQSSPYAFRALRKDPVFGEWVGVPQRFEEYFPAEERTGPVLERVPWSKHAATLREGGVAFLELLVGDGGATLKNSGDVNVHVVLVRYSTLKKPSN